MKALPMTYNRDLQEDKEALFDTVDTLSATLDVLSGTMATLNVRKERMAESVSGGFVLSTDVADYLAKRGMPFREAHGVVGELVQYALGVGKDLTDLTLEEYRRFSAAFDADVLEMDVGTSLSARSDVGGTAPQTVRAALARWKERLAKAHE